MDQPRPSDYPIGSPESRAAARMWLKNTRDTRPRFEIVTHIYHPDEDHRDETMPYATGWSNWGDKLMRMVYHPIHWEKSPNAPMPICRGCGTPYRKRETDFPGMILFEFTSKYAPSAPPHVNWLAYGNGCSRKVARMWPWKALGCTGSRSTRFSKGLSRSWSPTRST